MGFLNLFRSKEPSSVDPDKAKIVYAFYEYFRMPSSDFLTRKKLSKEQEIVKSIIFRENRRAMTVAFEALEYLGEPTTWSELVFALDILPHTGAGGSKTTIKYGERLFSGLYTDDSNNPILPTIYIRNSYLLHMRNFKLNMAKAYEHESNYVAALDIYKAIETETNYEQLCVESISRCFVRLGRFTDAIDYLEQLKKLPIYKKATVKNHWGDPEKNYVPASIDSCLADVLEKSARGYTYRQRKIKDINPLSTKYTYCDE